MSRSKLHGIVLHLLVVVTAWYVGSYTPAKAAPSGVQGVWIDKTSPKSKLKLFLKQDGYVLSGYFSTGSRKWPVEGSMSGNGIIYLLRSHSVDELKYKDEKGNVNTLDPAGKKYVIGKRRDLARPNHVSSIVFLEIKESGNKIEGYYEKLGVSKAGANYKILTKRVTLSLTSEAPMLVDSSIRFHRLFLIGPGKNRNEDVALAESGNNFRSAIINPLISGPPGKQVKHSMVHNKNSTIPPSMEQIKRDIANIASDAKPGDQILIYISAHGAGGAENFLLRTEYEKEFFRQWKKYKSSKLSEREIKFLTNTGNSNNKRHAYIKKANMMGKKLNTIKKEFIDIYLKSIRDGKIKKFDDVEIFSEAIWIRDLNNDSLIDGNELLHDYEFAKLIKPILEARFPVTVVMDSCKGGGFGDNLKKYNHVKVIGLKTNVPGTGDSCISNVMTELIKKTVKTGSRPVRITAEDAKYGLRKIYGHKVGAPFDDIRDTLQD